MKSVRKLHNLNAWERKAASSKSLATSLVTPTGIDGLDGLLPGGGWPRGGLVELIVPDEYTDAISLVMPALVRLSRQGRWIAMVSPPCQTRGRLFTCADINPARVLQVNPHPGRSALWTAESMLQSGTCGVVLAWPNCNTELMDKRLQKAAASGKALGVLVRYEGLSVPPSGVDVRLKVDVGAEGKAVYLVDSQGKTLSGAALV
jgi:cell division inhibitor SulA/protein ImuA